MYLLRIVAFFFSLFFLINLRLLGTTVYPVEKKCPVCLNGFITTIIGSYYFFEEPERDFSGRYFSQILTCPNCLYSSLQQNFDEIDEVERMKLKKWLSNIKLNFESIEKKVILEIKSPEEFVPIILARECYKIRNKNKKYQIDFLYYQYFRTKSGYLNKLHPLYRKNMIKGLKSLLGEEYYKDKEKALHTYLLGELYRLDGQDKKALLQFTKAIALSQKLPTTDKWIEKWSFEQSCRINFPKLSIQALAELINEPKINSDKANGNEGFQRDLALQVLAKNNDNESWAIIGKHVMQDISRLDHLDTIVALTKEKLQIDKNFWQWIQSQYLEAESKVKESGENTENIWKTIYSRFSKFTDNYIGEDIKFNLEVKSILEIKDDTIFFKYTTKPGDTLKRIAYHNQTSVPRILELNPQLKNEDSVAANTMIDLLRTPTDYPESVFLGYVGRLLEAKDKSAEKYFFLWIKTIGPNYFYGFNYCVLKCLLALNSYKDSWQMPLEGDLNANNEQRMIYQCLKMIKGDKNAEEKLLDYIQSKNQNGISIPLGILKVCNSKKAKNLVIEILKVNNRYPENEILTYLSWVATVEDLPVIQSLIKNLDNTLKTENENGSKYFQQDIERIISKIKLIALVKKSLE